MVFKGTETRSAEAIARQVDSIGGNMDALHGRRNAYASTLKSLMSTCLLAMDVLTDLVLHPTFDVEDIARERGVILEGNQDGSG